MAVQVQRRQKGGWIAGGSKNADEALRRHLRAGAQILTTGQRLEAELRDECG
jgi:hypothetical protein